MLLELAQAACSADDLPLYAPENFAPMLRAKIEELSAGRADHVPFEEAGVPYLFFSTSEHDDYHSAGDTLDKVDPEVLRRVAMAAYRTVLAIDALKQRPRFQPEDSQKR